MLTKFGIFQYVTCRNVQIALNAGAFGAALYQLYTNPHNYTAKFVLDLTTHGVTLMSMHPNANELIKTTAFWLNVGSGVDVGSSLALGVKAVPAPVGVVDLGIHLSNGITISKDMAHHAEEETASTIKMK